MLHPETHRVTAKHGPRPAGSSYKCFYCDQGFASDHKADCVLRQRTVLVRATIEYAIAVPEDWSSDMVEFHRNDSSWCCGNMIGELEAINESHGCLCNVVKFEFVREATADDEDRSWVRPSDFPPKPEAKDTTHA